LGLKKESEPTRPFMHAPDCKLMKADPTTEIKWQEVETGLWVAECQCGKEYERDGPRTSVSDSIRLTRPRPSTHPSASTAQPPIL
jgi:hypothetical protein